MLASSNETTGLTTDTERKLVASNTPAKCEYVCKPGYVYNSLLKKCELPTYQCIGTIPANAVLIPGDDQGLTANTPRKLVASNTSAKCEYTCKPGFVNLMGTCSPLTTPKQCIGTVPANAVLIPGDDQGLTVDTPRKLVASNTSAKCEYLCAEGFKYEKGKCVAKEWRCTKFEQTYQNNGYGAADTYCRQNAPQYFA